MRTHTFVAPVRGWVMTENMAMAQMAGAKVLDNWAPTQTGIRIRGGSELKATIGTGAVESLFTYVSGAQSEIFAADTENVYNITLVGDPTIIPTPDIAGQTGGEYSTFQFETSGGDFLYIVNGKDKPQLYDGTAWTAIDGTSTPAITGVTTSTLSQGWVYRSRIWFIQGGTTTAWYLPVDQLGGAASDFSLAGVFQKGGALLFGATWSLDSGSGLDDKVVFVSSEGEVAVFEGSTPSDQGWSLVGRYDIAPPLGKDAKMQAGGDLLILTEDGIVPISQVIQKDPAALNLAAVTRPIEPAWRSEVSARKSLPWQIVKWPVMGIAIVSLPVVNGDTPPRCLVVNLATGAWGRYTGWDTRSLTLYNGWGYFGTSDGKVMKAETGGADNGLPYACTYVGLFEHMGDVAATKVLKLARASFLSGNPFVPQLSASVNYSVSLPSEPDPYVESQDSNVWDVAKWDEAKWSGIGERQAITKWVGIGAAGFTIAPQVQITVSQTGTPDAELASFDIVFERAGVVV